MCAAPGSKTAQLVEFLHADESVAVPGEFLGIGNSGCGKDCVSLHKLHLAMSFHFRGICCCQRQRQQAVLLDGASGEATGESLFHDHQPRRVAAARTQSQSTPRVI